MSQSAIRIVLVDDSPEWANMLVCALERRGFSVHACLTVDEGIDALDGWRPDIIISDYSMPERSGIELLTEVSNRRPDIISRGAFVFLTGSPEIVRAQIGDLDIPVLQKPQPFDPLAELLHSLVAER